MLLGVVAQPAMLPPGFTLSGLTGGKVSCSTFCNMSILQVVHRRQPWKEHLQPSAGEVWTHRVNCPPSLRSQQEIGVLPKNTESLKCGPLNCSPRNMSTQLRDQLLSFSLGDAWKARGEQCWEKRPEPRLGGPRRKMSNSAHGIPKWNWREWNFYEKRWVMLPKGKSHAKKQEERNPFYLRNW